MKKKLIIVIGLVLIMCLLGPLPSAKAQTVAPAPTKASITTQPEPPTPPEPGFAIPKWALYTIIGSGGLFLFGLGYRLGRRSASMSKIRRIREGSNRA